MKYIHVITILALSITYISCSKIPGYSSGYKNLSAEDKNLISFLPKDSSIHLSDSNNIQAINAIQLKEIIDKEQQTLVYIWAPNCKSKVCIPISTAKIYGDKTKSKVIILMEYYNLDILRPQTDNFVDIYGINYKAYNSNVCNIYMRRFLKDLTSTNNQIPLGDRFLFFEKGKFINSKPSLF